MTCFCLALFGMFARAQGWMRTYGGPDTLLTGYSELEPNHGAIAMPAIDGHIMLAGWGQDRNAPGSTSDFFMLKTNEQGDEIWRRFYGDSDQIEYCYTAKALPDGGYVLAGKKTLPGASPGNIADMMILRTNSNGDPIWTKQFNFANRYDEIYDVALTSDGGFACTGRIDNLNSQDSVYILKLNASGEVEWFNRYIPSTVNSVYFIRCYAILQTPDNGYVIGGRVATPSIVEYLLIRTDSQGNVLWERVFSENQGEDNQINDLIMSQEGDGFIALGTKERYFGVHNIELYKYNDQGTQIWRREWDLPGWQDGATVIQNEGGYLICGTNWNPQSGIPRASQVSLIQTDANGNTLWQKEIGTGLWEQGRSVFKRADGNLVIGGGAWRVGVEDQAMLILADPSGNLYHSAIAGQTELDENSDCIETANDPGAQDWVAKITGEETWYAISDEAGNYQAPVPLGDYSVRIFPPSPYHYVCEIEQDAVVADLDTVMVNFLGQEIVECPYLEVDLSSFLLRRCSDARYTANYCNRGTMAAENAYVDITLDPDLTLVESSIPAYLQEQNRYRFLLGNVAEGECGTFNFDVLVACDAVLGQTHCVEAHIYPDSLCLPQDSIWNGSSLALDAYCDGDSIFFIIQNVGQGAMNEPTNFIVVEDQIILLEGLIPTLLPGEIHVLSFDATGQTITLQVQQPEGHPGNSTPIISIEGCDGWQSLGIINQFPQDDADAFIDIECQENVDSFDPNDKTASPEGIGISHWLAPNQDIEYRIRFQNTGTAPAIHVLIRDFISPHFDLTTVRPGASSHPYTFGMEPTGEFFFRFANINLPDTAANFEASQGYVSFRVSQHPDLPDYTLLSNTAGIYFDYNDPVITNTVTHTVHRDPIRVATAVEPEPEKPQARLRIWPSPAPGAVNVLVENAAIKQGELRLYNAMGQLVAKQNLSSPLVELQRNGRSAGLYFIEIVTQEGRVASGQVIWR